MLGVVGTALAVLAWPEEEEESDPGEIADINVSWCGSLGGSVQALDNADRGGGVHSCWSGIFLITGSQLASQPKVKLLHAVVPGVVGPHGCECFKDILEVLLERLLLDRLPLRRQKSGTDTLGKHL